MYQSNNLMGKKVRILLSEKYFPKHTQKFGRDWH